MSGSLRDCGAWPWCTASSGRPPPRVPPRLRQLVSRILLANDLPGGERTDLPGPAQRHPV
ncbi:hypothetical protein QJS66_19495 [Kocuria rhizophila]|nr:hypothetical protein QJS66_19495 [Kocuria rhizophila]